MFRVIYVDQNVQLSLVISYASSIILFVTTYVDFKLMPSLLAIILYKTEYFKGKDLVPNAWLIVGDKWICDHTKPCKVYSLLGTTVQKKIVLKLLIKVAHFTK